MGHKTGLLDRAKMRLLSTKFAAACLREAGNIEHANEMMRDVTRVQDHLASVLAFSSPELAGEGLIESINDRIFSSDNAPLDLPTLFRRQAEQVHHAERAQYDHVITPDDKERLKQGLKMAGAQDANAEQLDKMAEALIDMSLCIGDNCRNLGDSLNALAATLERLPQTIQNMALRPHLDLIKANNLVPQELQL